MSKQITYKSYEISTMRKNKAEKNENVFGIIFQLGG